MTGFKKEFDESLLSGYLDGVLTQADEQRVRLYLEDSAEARRLLDELRSLRDLTLESDFRRVPDDQWDERRRGGASRVARRLGWLVFTLWLAATSSYAFWQFFSGPESLQSKVLVFAGLSGVGLLFLSVLIDRLTRLRGDRYRGVER